MRRMVPNILSLDLDWFNWIDVKEHGRIAKKKIIVDFFAHLRLRCSLPSTAAFMTEHHYFYPWCEEVMKSLNANRVNVYNVDEHHDFYHLADIDDYDTHLVSCANFFAFMAHRKMIGQYHWLYNGNAKTSSRSNELMRELGRTYSRTVRSMSERTTVNSRDKLWSVLGQKKFAGFAIVKSLDYTKDQDIVFPAVNAVMRKYFTPVGVKVGRSLCRADYSPKQRPLLNVGNLLPA